MVVRDSFENRKCNLTTSNFRFSFSTFKSNMLHKYDFSIYILHITGLFANIDTHLVSIILKTKLRYIKPKMLIHSFYENSFKCFLYNSVHCGDKLCFWQPFFTDSKKFATFLKIKEVRNYSYH